MARSEIESFLAEYKKAVEAGMFREDFAASMGILTDTVYQRIYKLQKDGLPIPQLKLRTSLTFLERAAAAWGATPTVDKKLKPKPAEKAVEQPVTPVAPPVPAHDVMDEITKLLG